MQITTKNGFLMNRYYPVSAVRTTVGRRRTQLSVKHADKFLADLDYVSIEKRQIDLFNVAWQKAQRLAFYKEWKRIYDLPTSISSIQELSNWPTLTKNDLRERLDLVEMTPEVIGSYRTSGSTGEPFNFPRGVGEFPGNYSTMWSYRSAHGIRPFDPFLLVANTSTGSGQSRLAQAKNRTVRALKDLAGNSWKTDGFISTDDAADKALRTMSILRPKYLIGYPSGIAAIARRAEKLNSSFPSITHVILTSETIDAEDIQLIERVLQVQVLIEYGAVELGAVAGSSYESKGWPLRVHWWSFLVRLADDKSGLITTLEPRSFPLINYSIGDMIQADRISPQGSVLSISHVDGRVRDVVKVRTRDGLSKTVSARGLTTLIRDLSEVISIQVSQRGADQVELYVVAPQADQDRLVKKISSSFMRNRSEFQPGSVFVAFLHHHIPSARGKRGVLIDSKDVPSGVDFHSIIVA